MIETLTIRLAGPAIKLLAKWVLPESSAEPVGDGLADLVESRLDIFEEKRKAKRFLEDLQDEVAAKLSEALKSLFPRLKPHDLNAATLTVGDALREGDLAAGVAQSNIDPDALYGRLRQASAEKFFHLGGEAALAADFLLRQTCYYLVRLVDRLPDFKNAVGRELLMRSASLSDDMRKVLEAVNELTKDSRSAARGDGDTFESSYRLAVVRALERLQLFGVKEINEAANNYPLSVAFVALSVKGSRNAESMPVQDALIGRTRLLLRGEAGSGKTTIMQWLAVRSASRSLPRGLASWDLLLPIYIRLRDFANDSHAFPTPEAMLEGGAAANVAGLMPDGWMHSVLSGRALLLLDGADELPSAKRRRMCQWVDKLLTDFPSAVCVISSRPAALDVSDFQGGFEELSLEPMRLRQCQELVLQWHEAVASNMIDRQKLLQLERSRLSIQAALPMRPALRALSSNPLLCAMMCALNLRFEGKIPSDRMTLYQLSIQMLTERRDADREITSELLQQVGSGNLKEVLDQLAYWMLRNGLSEATYDDVLSLLQNLLPRFGSGLNPKLVLQLLLERSGVLRQPEHNVVDFMHKTFMEYMGARAAVAANDIGLLAEQAQQESWREAVVFAVGHASGVSRDRLVRRLLARPIFRLGRRSIQSDITVVCALETGSKDLDPQVLDQVLELATSLFPPKQIDHAWALAPAAAERPELLLGHSEADPVGIAGCIRCASVIGGARMLEVIASYAGIDEPQVRHQIFDGWSNFDDIDYGEQVVAVMPWFVRLLDQHGSPGADRKRLLRFLHILCYRNEHDNESTLVESCRVFMQSGIVCLGGPDSYPIATLDHVRNQIAENKGRQKITTLDLERLTDIAPVRSVRLRAPTDPGALDGAPMVDRISELCLDPNLSKRPVDWARLASLTELTLSERSQSTLELGSLKSLRALALVEGGSVAKEPMEKLLLHLESLAIVDREFWRPYEGMKSPTLKTLVLIGDVLGERGKLDFSACSQLRNLVCIGSFPIHIKVPPSLQDLRVGASWTAVEGDLPELLNFAVLSGKLAEGGAFLSRARRLSSVTAGTNVNLSADVESMLSRSGVLLARDATAMLEMWKRN